MRGATYKRRDQRPKLSHFNPRTPCGVRPFSHGGFRRKGYISIHAPRAGCDMSSYPSITRTVFQSTHPVRGATVVGGVLPRAGQNFNPRTPCGVRRDLRRGRSDIANFNPRTPCGVRRQTCTTWFAPIFATLPNQMYVCLHYTCFTTLFQPKTWFSAVFQRCEAPRESMSAPASHRVKASAAPPAHRSAWRRYAQRGSDSYSQDCKSAGCPSPG